MKRTTGIVEAAALAAAALVLAYLLYPGAPRARDGAASRPGGERPTAVASGPDAVASARREPAGNEPAGSSTRRIVTMRESHSGAPIEGASLIWTSLDDGATQIVNTASDGTARLNAPGRGLLFATARGFGSDLFELPESGVSLVLTLSRSGNLLVSFVDEFGKAVPDIEAVCLSVDAASAVWTPEGPSPDAIGVLRSHGGGVADVAAAWLAATRAGAEGRSSLLEKAARTILSLRRTHPGELIDWLRTAVRAPAALARSDSAGEAAWPDLAAEGAWRLGVITPRSCEVQPPHEARGATVEQGAVSPGDRAPVNLSGVVDIRAGETTRHRIVVYGQTGFRGRIVQGDGTPHAADISLEHEWQHSGDSGGLRYIESLVETSFQTARDGTFESRGVREGRKMLRAQWRAGDNDYYFLQKQFELQKGEVKDLGDLAPRNGDVVRIAAPLLDEAGRAVPATDVFAGTPPDALLSFGSEENAAAPDEKLWEIVSCPPGSSLVFHGLAPGQWSASVMDIPGATERLRPDLYLSFAGLDLERRTIFHVPPDGIVNVPIVVKPTVTGPIDIRFPAGVAASPVRVFFNYTIPGSATEISHIDLDPAASDGSFRTRLRFFRKEYILWAATTGPNASPGQSYFGIARVDTSGGIPGDTVVLLSPGATVHGRLVSAGGSPRADRKVPFTISSIPGAESMQCALTVTTRADGTFVLSGLPPGSLLTSAKHAAVVHVGPAGSDAEIGIVDAKDGR
jgi:hypothetical protein